MLLENKVAVVYGAGGAIGGAVAHGFAQQGAHVFLAGRRRATVDAVAEAIRASGGRAEVAEVDALDESAISRHLEAVVGQAGRLDISFNAVGLHDDQVLGTPLAELGLDAFLAPLVGYTRSFFLTARTAARHMAPRKQGVIMTLSALPARTGTRLNGGYGPAQAAKEAMVRDLSAELAPQGLRVVGLRPHGLPETRTMRATFEAKATGMSWEQFQGYLANMAHPKRTQSLAEVAPMAAFMASDLARGMTGTIVNLTMGSLDD